MALQVRPAQSNDLSFLAWATYESMLPGTGRGIFDGALEGTGVSPLAFHETLLRTGASNWGGIQDFLVLEDGGQSLAAAAAYRPDAKDLRPLTAQGFQRTSKALGWSLELARRFWIRYVAVFGPFGNAPQLAQPADYVIEYVAVSPGRRGRGLVRALLDGHARRARAQGCASLGISVMAGNRAALSAYRKYGFVPCRTLTVQELGGGFPGITRLMLKLRTVSPSEKQKDVSHGVDI